MITTWVIKQSFGRLTIWTCFLGKLSLCCFEPNILLSSHGGTGRLAVYRVPGQPDLALETPVLYTPKSQLGVMAAAQLWLKGHRGTQKNTSKSSGSGHLEMKPGQEQRRLWLASQGEAPTAGEQVQDVMSWSKHYRSCSSDDVHSQN